MSTTQSLPSSAGKSVNKQFYTKEEMIYLRRTILAAARSLPRGPERNYKRQIASSLRSLFENKAWLAEHTI
jgi:hypothetical protein